MQVIAVIQSITFREYLPVLLGHECPIEAASPDPHHPEVSGQIAAEFAGIASRHFYFGMRETVQLLAHNGTVVSTLPMEDTILAPHLVSLPLLTLCLLTLPSIGGRNHSVPSTVWCNQTAEHAKSDVPGRVPAHPYRQHQRKVRSSTL